MRIRWMVSILLILSLCLGGIALAEGDEICSLTGIITDGTMNSVSVRWEDGNVYTFIRTGEEDTAGLTGGLTIGHSITIYYTGDIQWDTADASAAHVTAISDGLIDFPYGFITDEKTLEADYDGDGSTEVASIVWRDSSDMEQMATLQIGSATFESEIISQVQAVVCDLDIEDGKLDILFTGNVMSDDFVTWRLQYSDGMIVQVGDPFDGLVTDYAGGFVTVCRWVDVLGTHWGQAQYALNEDGVLSISESGEWYITEQDDDELYEMYAITPIIDLPVTLLTDEGETESSLPAGTRIHIISSDLTTYAFFQTDDGQFGYLAIGPSEKGWGMSINGQDEDVYFENLPYSG